jgi:glycosyltransferase involved in cell wall biosynthesis
MRIGINALYSISNALGGMETYQKNIIKSIVRSDEKNYYVIFANEKNYESFTIEQNNGEKVLCSVKKGLGARKIFWEQCMLPLQAAKNKIDVLFSPAYIAPAFLPCKSVVTIHCMKYSHHPEDFDKIILPYLKSFIPLSARRSDRIITVSHYTKSELVKNLNLNDKKVSVIYYGIAQEFNPNLGFDLKSELSNKYNIKDKYILSVAALKSHKNVLSIIKAFSVLKRKYGLEHKLVLVGHGEKKLSGPNELVRELSMESDVLFVGGVPNEQLAPLYCGADLFVFLSLYESFGMPLTEAMACGTPVISSNRTAMPEIVGDAGILVNPLSIDEIAFQMNRALIDKQLRTDLIEKGLERAKIFSWEKAAQKLLSVLYETVGN